MGHATTNLLHACGPKINYFRKKGSVCRCSIIYHVERKKNILVLFAWSVFLRYETTSSIWLVVAQYTTKHVPCEVKRIMAVCPSQTWYLMQDSELRPTSGRSEDNRVTGKKRKAQQRFPTSARRTAAVPNLDCHLRAFTTSIPSKIIIYTVVIN